MKRIEIITPQQVPITFQVAPVRERMLAFLLDAIILFGIITLMYTLLSAIKIDDSSAEILNLLIISPFFIFYSLAFELFTGGQSPGKIAMKIRVIKLSGQELSLTDYFLRWAFRWIDIWGSLGSIAALQISSSGKGQRLGDLLADTSVIRIQGDYKIKLDEILKIDSMEGYEPMYPQIIQLSEKEMLSLKMALDQYKKFPNTGHLKVLASCSVRLRERLGIPPEKSDPLVFLNRLLKDYVTITRS
jgi:uncharacterized RDD family membrane protein YckC